MFAPGRGARLYAHQLLRPPQPPSTPSLGGAMPTAAPHSPICTAAPGPALPGSSWSRSPTSSQIPAFFPDALSGSALLRTHGVWAAHCPPRGGGNITQPDPRSPTHLPAPQPHSSLIPGTHNPPVFSQPSQGLGSPILALSPTHRSWGGVGAVHPPAGASPARVAKVLGSAPRHPGWEEAKGEDPGSGGSPAAGSSCLLEGGYGPPRRDISTKGPGAARELRGGHGVGCWSQLLVLLLGEQLPAASPPTRELA